MSNDQNETAKTAYYHGTIQKCHENSSKKMLSICLLCHLSILL